MVKPLLFMKQRQTDNYIVILFTIFVLLFVGFVIGYITRSTKPPNATPTENPIYFSDDSRSAEIYFSINEERALHDLPLLKFDCDIASEAMEDAKFFTFKENEAIYIIGKDEPNKTERIMKVWKESAYYSDLILNEDKTKIGVITYCDEQTKMLLYIARFD